jgi:hypothetical protein
VLVKSLIVVPLGVIAATLVAWAGLRQFTGDGHAREVMTAGGIALIACELAIAPLLLARKAGQIAVAQAGLVGTVLHMFFMLATGAAAYWMKLAGNQKYFLFLLLGFYWVSLILIVAVMIKAIRTAPVTRAGPPVKTA